MTENNLTGKEIALHWVVGIGVIALLAMGKYMSQTEAFSLYGLHKSLGITLFAFILVRTAIRLRRGWPSSVSEGAAWEHKLAHLTHWALIAATLVMPLSGIMDSYMSGRGVSVFELQLITSNIGSSGRPEAINESLSELSEMVHIQTGNILIGAVVLHIVGALKHHIVDRDGTLNRMLVRG